MDGILELVVDKDADILYRIRANLGAKPTVGKIILLFTKREFISRNSLYDYLYGDREDGGPDRDVIDTWICYARPLLAAHGVFLKTVHGQGWSMDHQNRRRLKSLIEPKAMAA